MGPVLVVFTGRDAREADRELVDRSALELRVRLAGAGYGVGWFVGGAQLGAGPAGGGKGSGRVGSAADPGSPAGYADRSSSRGS